MTTQPARIVIDGNYMRLEPLELKHAQDLWEAQSAPGEKERFKYLFDLYAESKEELVDWITKRLTLDDPIFFAIIDKQTQKAGGRQALMRIKPEHRAVEIGSVYYGPTIARTRLATEALFCMARYVFEDLGYRRFEWKCNILNEPSQRAALRFGFSFEGIFRNHMIVKGESRDTAWYSMIDSEWPERKAMFERWLRPNNFDSNGRQKTKLGEPC